MDLWMIIVLIIGYGVYKLLKMPLMPDTRVEMQILHNLVPMEDSPFAPKPEAQVRHMKDVTPKKAASRSKNYQYRSLPRR